MRLGVLDVGSNTVHLLVVDAHHGGPPLPQTSVKSVLRLAEQMDARGKITREGADHVIRTVREAVASAAAMGCEDLMAFATSAMRDASNSVAVLNRVHAETGVTLDVLSGEEEAILTFLAVRRWCGWSAGRLLMVDVGGGSLEIASGVNEEPDVAVSLPLGAGRLTRSWLANDPPRSRELETLREHVVEQLVEPTRKLRTAGAPDRVVGTSKTIRSLARLSGAAPSSAGPRVRRTLTDAGLRQVIAFISRMSAEDLAELEGVSASRSHQLVAGALVVQATMHALDVDEMDLCPWALREGVILRRLDWLDGIDRMAQPGRRPPRRTRRKAGPECTLRDHEAQ
ncbi:MAG: Ppx/GppA family phosphatase [Pseudonocardiales bacterium]|nr:Ppx/GppA family phosphatase [Pseudonocardiales bacterium]MBV9028977.1 Ppx/GppA family phosphatase [Pseudonocardiales bacterium]MBW0009643.1 Ppx/GppA family phosphatase [Pseudonocardiales bacterium]